MRLFCLVFSIVAVSACNLVLFNAAGRLNVIVCVLDATSDWEAAAAISWAKQYNPSGDRTLFVITKIDRAVPGFRHLLDTLQRQYIRTQSKLGYVLVRHIIVFFADLCNLSQC